NKTQMQTQESKVDMGKALDADLVVTKISRTGSEVQDERSRSGNDTDTDGQRHSEQPEIIDEGRVNQYTEKCQVKSHVLDSSLDNKITEFSNQSLESENIFLKKDDSKPTHGSNVDIRLLWERYSLLVQARMIVNPHMVQM
ncbi:hypothetical protein Tco_0076081, partial [Tanacetum coccineum]